MATLTGTAGNDYILGEAGADTILGLGGADFLSGAGGDDIVAGGDGDDYIEDGTDGSDTLRGEAGDDTIRVLRDLYGRPAESITIEGGDGNDTVTYHNYSAAEAVIDGGAGDDAINLDGVSNNTRLILGAGRDTVSLTVLPGFAYGTVVIDDFATGETGDSIDWLDTLADGLSGWDQSFNPFASGHLLFRQDGADAILRVDRDGAAGAGEAQDLVVFRNADARTFTAGNLGGYAADGSIEASRVLTGGEGGEMLAGGGGHDRLTGNGGDDRLNGGGGDDRLFGGLGSDTMRGGAGDDELSGNDGDDFIADTSGGSDTLNGGEGNDTLFLYRLNRTLNETATIKGGAGDDRITDWSYAQGLVTIDAGGGADTVTLFTSDHDQRITLGEGTDTLDLTRFQTFSMAGTTRVVTDFATGAAGDTVLLGDLLTRDTAWDGAGNPFATGDVRLITRGADSVLQIRIDTFPLGYRDLLLFRDAARGSFTAENFGGYGPDGSAPVGRPIVGTANDDRLSGTVAGEAIDGLEGNDILYGDAGDDRITGGAGDDQIDGGGGDDVIDAGDGNDFVTMNGGGSDTIATGAGRDVVTYFRNNVDVVETVAIDTGADDDSVSYQNFNNGSVAIALGTGDDRLSLFGHRGAAEITLGDGADTLDLGELYPTDLFGEYTITLTDYAPGVDRILLRDFLDSALRGWDHQSNPFTRGYLKIAQVGDDVAITLDIDGRGSTFQPVGWLNLRDVKLTNLTRADLDGIPPGGGDLDRNLTGGDEANVLRGGTGNDTIEGGKGDDRLSGSRGADVLRGGEGDDILLGDRDADRLDGGAGNDTLTGGAGRDVLTGGGGRDVFRIVEDDTADTRARADEITDFDRSERDKINVSLIDADRNVEGDQAFRFVGTAVFSGSAGELRWARTGADCWIAGDTDGDAVADWIVKVDGVTAIVAGDLIL